MSLTDPNIFDKAWGILKMKPVYIGLSLLAALIVLAYILSGVQSCRFQSGLDKSKANVNAKLAEANAINAQLANLHEQEIIKQVEVNAAKIDLEKARKETDDAQKIANQALDNVNAVTNRDFNGTSADNANRARCAAFPNAPECRP